MTHGQHSGKVRMKDKIRCHMDAVGVRGTWRKHVGDTWTSRGKGRMEETCIRHMDVIGVRGEWKNKLGDTGTS